MPIFLMIFNEESKITLLGCYIFSSFKQLIEETKGFFSYNDSLKLESKKKRIFKIIKIKNKNKYNEDN